MGMKRNIHPITLVVLTACTPSPEREALRALQAGGSHYAAGRYAEAAQAYDAVRDDPRTVYNAGVAHFRNGAWSASADRFTEAAVLADDRRRPVVLYDLGTTEARRALWADSMAHRAGEVLDGIRIDGDDIARKVSLLVLRDSLRKEQRRLTHLSDSSLGQAENQLKQALRMAPTDEDARYNLAAVQAVLAARRGAGGDGNDGKQDKDQQQELSAKAKLLVQRADELVEEHRFQEALGLLQRSLQQEPSLKNEQEFMQKLEVVTKAAKAT